MRTTITTLLFLAAAFSQMGATGGACGGQVLRDPGFDLWCGDSLCAWKVERGEIKRVATWHEGDAGVQMMSTDTAIEQVTPVNSGDGNCMTFNLLAYVEDNAEVYFNVDVEGDGTNEMHERIPTSNWKPYTYTIGVTDPYDGIRFEITKKGSGKVILANIGAQLAHTCDGLDLLDPGPRPPGGLCALGTACQGSCIASPTPIPSDPLFANACGGCDPSAGATACPAGSVCGLGAPTSPLLAVGTGCVAPASKELGEECILDSECGSGICWKYGSARHGVCSACRTSQDCTNGGICNGAVPGSALVCGGGAHFAKSGWPCGNDDDCASGVCGGTPRSQCSDARPCAGPYDCPFEVNDQHIVQNGACIPVGVQGGTCQ